MRNLVILYHIYFCIYTTIYHASVILDSLHMQLLFHLEKSACTCYPLYSSQYVYISMMSMKKVIQEISLPVQVQNE